MRWAALVRMPPELLAMIKEKHIAALATVGPDGTPNVSPKGFTYLDDETLAYVDIYSARTLSNIRANPKVAVAIWDNRSVSGFQVKGTARIHGPGDPVYEEVVARYIRAHHPDGRGVPEHMWIITIKVEAVYSLKPSDRGKCIA